MKSVLLLTDFSSNSKNAIVYAQHLFKEELCRFYVLYVKDASTYTSDDLMGSRSNQSLYSSLVSKSEIRLDNFVKKIEQHNPLHTFKSVIDRDIFIDAVNQSVIKFKIDLVVMGTNGASDLKETVFGSNALNVLRSVDCNTLVVPTAFKFSQVKNVLLALDIQDNLNDKTVLELLNFVRLHAVKLKVLRIISLENSSTATEIEDQKWLSEHLKPSDFDYATIPDVPLTYVVNTFVHTQPVDLIAFVGQYKNFVGRLFGTSEKTKITKTLNVPLLIFHN